MHIILISNFEIIGYIHTRVYIFIYLPLKSLKSVHNAVWGTQSTEKTLLLHTEVTFLQTPIMYVLLSYSVKHISNKHRYTMKR